LIEPFQGSFIPGRGTIENAILAQEAIHSIAKSKANMGFAAIKVDLEKTYD